MKKAILCAAAMSILLCACSDSSNGSVAEISATPEQTTVSQPAETTSDTTSEPDTLPVILAEYLNALPADTYITFLREISADCTLICEAANDRYAVYTYDAKTGTQSEARLCDTLPQCGKGDFWVLTANTGQDAASVRSAVTMLDTDTYSQALVIGYDMQEIGTIPLPNGFIAESFDIETDTGRLAYSATVQQADDSFVYRIVLTNSDFADEQVVFETPLMQNELSLYQTKLIGDRIAFSGGCMSSANAQSKPAYGWLNADTGAFTYESRSDGYDYAVTFCDAGAYVFDAGYPYGTAPTGTVFRLANGEIVSLRLQNAMESLRVYPSAGGEYFATVLEGINEDGSDLARISVYDTAGSLVKSFDLSFANDGRHYVDSLFVFEQTRTVYAQTVHAGVGSEWYHFQF